MLQMALTFPLSFFPLSHSFLYWLILLFILEHKPLCVNEDVSTSRQRTCKWTPSGRPERERSPFLRAVKIPLQGPGLPTSRDVTSLLNTFFLPPLRSVPILRSTIPFLHNTSESMRNDLPFSFASFQHSSLEHWLCLNFPFCPLEQVIQSLQADLYHM